MVNSLRPLYFRSAVNAQQPDHVRCGKDAERANGHTTTNYHVEMSDLENSTPVYLGTQPIRTSTAATSGEEVTIEGETYYKISTVDRMRPFFMSIVSHSDHWMFLASNGGLSAGRVNSDYALFPYYTDDKITEAAETTGSKTIILTESDGRRMLWQPFSEQNAGVYTIERNLYKNTCGNKVIFEEVNHDLALTFSYQWAASERFGFMRQARLKSSASTSTQVSVLDGIQNVLPHGVPEGLQRSSSNSGRCLQKMRVGGGQSGHLCAECNHLRQG